MVRDIAHYRDGTTDAILLLVGEDQQQLTKIANDFKSLLLRRDIGIVNGKRRSKKEGTEFNRRCQRPS